MASVTEMTVQPAQCGSASSSHMASQTAAMAVSAMRTASAASRGHHAARALQEAGRVVGERDLTGHGAASPAGAGPGVRSRAQS